MGDAKLPQNIAGTGSDRAQALERLHVICSLLEDDVPLAQITRERAILLRALSRWVKQYQEMGLKGLTRKRRSNERGKPDHLWLTATIDDHRSDFTSRYLEQVVADLEMELIFSEVGHLVSQHEVPTFFAFFLLSKKEKRRERDD